MPKCLFFHNWEYSEETVENFWRTSLVPKYRKCLDCGLKERNFPTIKNTNYDWKKIANGGTKNANDKS